MGTSDLSKSEAEVVHVQRRAVQRLGRHLGKKALQRLNQKLQEKDPAQVKFLWKTSNTRTVWAVKFDGEWIPVAYNKKSGQAITVLPLDVLDNYWDVIEPEKYVHQEESTNG